jgi:hypothetical protein
MDRLGTGFRLSLILLLGLAVRLVVAAASPAVSRDTCRFVWYAQGLQRSVVDTLRSQDQHPLYPALIAASHDIIGPLTSDEVFGWQAAAQASAMACGTLVGLAMFWLTAQMFDRRTALLAALFAVLLPEAVQYSADGLSDLPNALFYLMSLAAGLAALKGGRIWLWGASGFCGGLAFLVRPEGFEAVIVVGLLACVGRLSITARRRALGAVLLVAVAAGVCAPYQAIMGEVVPKKDVLRLFHISFESRTQQGERNAREATGNRQEDTVSGPAALAAGVPTRTARAAYAVLRDWVRDTRVVYLLVAVALWFGAHAPRADRVARRVVSVGWALHFVVLIALVLNYDYQEMLSKRHTLLLALLILPYSAAGTLSLVGRLAARASSERQRKLMPVLVVAAVVLAPAYWMLRPVNPDTEYLVRAGHWIRQNRKQILAGKQGRGLLMTADNRIPFYAEMPMQNWDEASGDLGVLEDHLRSFRPDVLAIDEYRLRRRNADFMWELEERLVRSGVLKVIHAEMPALGRRDTCLWIYQVRRVPQAGAGE